MEIIFFFWGGGELGGIILLNIIPYGGTEQQVQIRRQVGLFTEGKGN